MAAETVSSMAPLRQTIRSCSGGKKHVSLLRPCLRCRLARLTPKWIDCVPVVAWRKCRLLKEDH